MNLQPIIESGAIRINIPPMDESIRKDIAKKCRKYKEDAKVAIRDVRRKYNDMLKEKKASGEITEDEMKRDEKKVEVNTKRFCEDIDGIFSIKEKEILEI